MEQGTSQGGKPYKGKFSKYQNVEVPANTPSTYPARRLPKRSPWERVEEVTVMINKEFDSLGEFLELLFHNRDLSAADPRKPSHRSSVSAFLHGTNAITMSTIISLIYNHRASAPTPTSPEYNMMFSAAVDLSEIENARPCLLAWAARLVGQEVHQEMLKLGKNDSRDPSDTTQLRASTNGRAQNVQLVTWDAVNKLSIDILAKTFARRAPLAFFMTEWMAAPREHGEVVLRSRRPHPVIQVSAMSSFALSLNPYATGHLAMGMGIWLFACKAHVDLKRVLSRFGLSVHDKTIHDALKSLSKGSLTQLKKAIVADLADPKSTGNTATLLDNIQQYVEAHEEGIGRASQLKCGTAATAVRLDNCAPGAFDLKDHLDRVCDKKRLGLTAEGLFNDINWDHVANTQALHWVRALVEYIPQLSHYQKNISARFRGDLSIMRLANGRKTQIQPLGTNSEQEIKTDGMMRAILDFESQMGLEPSIMENSGRLFWIRGDGGSHAAVQRIKKYLSAHASDYESFRNRISLPEWWHTRATNLNSTARNHYGPRSSSDPSSLSKSSVKAGVKRPADLKKCDFYPTSRSLTLFWVTRVLDVWRIYFAADDIATHFAGLAPAEMPTFEALLVIAEGLVKRYASQRGHERALSKSESTDDNSDMRIAPGTPWTLLRPTDQPDAGGLETNALLDEDDLSEAGSAANEGKEGTIHIERPGFDGDRVLANEELFLEDHGWWIEAAYAVPDGDVGRLYEILKIWIFVFTGTSNRNYSDYMLDFYCLFKYEASQDLSNAILQNMLVNVTGDLGKWIEGDLLQEHYNRWLEDMVGKKGGEFDDEFYRHTLAPNVNHFLRLKEQIESAFDLKARSKAHTSPHLRSEYQRLLAMYKEEELHLFRSGRTLGHAAINYFGRGYKRLEEGRIASYLNKTTAYADIMADARARNELPQDPDGPGGAHNIGQLLQEPMLIDTNNRSQQLPSQAGSSRNSVGSIPSSDESSHSNIPQDLEYDSDDDRSDEKLSSGSYHTAFIDTETGSLVFGHDSDDEDNQGDRRQVFEEEDEAETDKEICETFEPEN
ncbi:hypothetical protein HWV62_19447 [Athelia sp. TMB]|nr:hypothetical protein HWV62_19447 [Athelia sp. TMB]